MAAALTEADITARLAALPGWAAENGVISKTYALDSYMAGLALASAIGTVCEGLDHHPDLYIGYKKVRVSFTTHSAGSQITAKDFEAATAVERLSYPRAK
jgi:4a-hydroxytetrahydrobiopterin dehydratase